jgi:hypothetical protein
MNTHSKGVLDERIKELSGTTGVAIRLKKV